MGFPRKFKELLEIELGDVDRPDEAWLTYAVCATEKDSCSWGGWMLENIRKDSGGKDSSLVSLRFVNKFVFVAERKLFVPVPRQNLFRYQIKSAD